MYQTCDPKHARLWFASRNFANVGISAVVFGFLLFILAQFASFPIALLIAGAVTFCLFFFYLEARSFGIVCPHCKGYIETNTPWICGYKGCRNENADDFPFIFECEHCRAKPKAYKCHHRGCEKLIFFTKDKQTFNFAQCINMPVPKSEPKPVKRDEHADAVTKTRKAIERKELEAKEAEIDLNLKSLRQALEPHKTIEEIYRAELKDEDAELRLRAKIDEEFKNDEVTRSRRHLVVDKIMREKL